MDHKMKKKKMGWIGLVIFLLVLAGGGYYWYTNVKLPHDNAISQFEHAKTVVDNENKVLDDAVTSAQAVIDSNETAYDETVLTDLQTEISSLKESKRVVPELPKNTQEIIDAAHKLQEPLDYSNELKNLESKRMTAENSIKQYQQIIHPTGDFVILRLKEVPSIVNIQAVTEENDPNGLLNKAGAYTSATYFSTDKVNQEEVLGSSLIEKGIDAGGKIEVYQTVEEANKRNAFISSFDGSILRSGSHNVVGTMVVRISDKLTATEQKLLEEEIIKKLIELQ